jgi:hypothetical protein
LNSTPTPFSFISSPIPETLSTDAIFTFTYMCTQYLHYISPSQALSPPHPSSHQCQLPGKTCCPTVVWFCKRKTKWHFCLRKLYGEFSCDISMHICVITQIGSSTLFLFFLL